MTRRALFQLALVANCLATLAAPVAAQGFTYAGLRWGLPSDSIRKSLIAKDFVFVKEDQDGDLLFRGKALDEIASVWAFVDAGRLVKVNVILVTPDQRARKVYAELKASLTEKYGEPESSFENFESPYYAGDGYEDQAIKLEKATFFTMWKKEALGGDSLMGLSITPQLAVSVEYESPRWSVVAKKRAKKAVTDF